MPGEPAAPVAQEVLAVDISNYTDELTDDDAAAWHDAGVRVVIFQAFPARYSQYAEQMRQHRWIVRHGFIPHAYAYDYLDAAWWLRECLAGLDQARANEALTVSMVWLDEEDVSVPLPIPETLRAIGAGVAMAEAAGYPVGIYTAKWWWGPRTGNTMSFSHLPLWDADYDGEPGVHVSWEPYGGWARRMGKQYDGDTSLAGVAGVDLNTFEVVL